jgi:hypothetical protein
MNTTHKLIPVKDAKQITIPGCNVEVAMGPSHEPSLVRITDEKTGRLLLSARYASYNFTIEVPEPPRMKTVWRLEGTILGGCTVKCEFDSQGKADAEREKLVDQFSNAVLDVTEVQVPVVEA